MRSKSAKPVVAAPAEAIATVEFDGLYRAYFGFVWRTLKRLGVADASLDDATQEVFVVVHRRFGDYRQHSAAKAWLFAIARNVANAQRRLGRRKRNLVSMQEEPASESASPLERAITRQASDLVLDFLAQLDDDRRAAFILSDLEQMTAPEIAAATHANLNTIYYRIASARRAFAAFVNQRRRDLPEPLHE